MLRWITIGVISLGLIGTGVWGYTDQQEKNAILIQSENTYQRAFHELSYHMDVLHDTFGTSLAMNSREKLSPQLVEIWRLTSEALSNVGQLPLTLLPFNKTEEFLSNIVDFTYRTAVRDLDKDPLSDKELQTLEQLYEQSADIKTDIREVQSLVLENNIRWMDVQLALSTKEEQENNTIIDSMKTVEKKVKSFTEGNTDSSLIGTQQNEHKYQYLKNEKKINEDKALRLSESLFEVTNDGEF